MTRAKRATKGRTKAWIERWRTPLLVLSAIRIVVSLLAIPLAPFLYRKHFLILVLMRPTKEVLLFGGFLVRQNKVHLLQILAAAVPLALFAVWLAYALGLAHASSIKRGKIPSWAKRILPRDRIKTLQKILEKKGPKLIILGRLAVFPSALLGTTAGVSDMEPRTFLAADGIGGVLSIIESLGAGLLLGGAYESGAHWITVAGVTALVAFAVLFGRYVRKA